MPGRGLSFLPEVEMPADADESFAEIIAKGIKGEIRDDALVEALLKARLFVCSLEAIQDNGEGFVPLVFERGDEALLGVFTDIEHARLHAAEAPFWIQMDGI